MAEPLCVCGHEWEDHGFNGPHCTMDCRCRCFSPAPAWLPLGVWPTEPGRYWFYGKAWKEDELPSVYMVDIWASVPDVLFADTPRAEIIVKRCEIIGPFRFAPAVVPEPPSLES